MSTLELVQSIVLDEDGDDFPRDHNGNPRIVPPGGGKLVTYLRCSSAAKLVDDTFGLELWNRRNVAYGVAHDVSLQARVLAVGGTPYTWERPQKDAVNDIVEAALTVAQAHKGADIGTAVHHMTHRADRGETVAAGPWQADLDAYHRTLATHGWSVVPEWTEVKIVCDDLGLAGTADRILVRGDEHVIADIKTGSVEYGALGWAAQLAAYAHGVIYDQRTGERLPTPDVDRRRGIIIHLPAGEGRCDLYEIDLEAGYEAVLLANQIRATRSAARRWMRPVEAPRPIVVETNGHQEDFEVPADVIARASADLRARLKAAVDAGATAIPWPASVPRFRDGGPRTWAECLAVEEAVAKIEADLGLPFPANGFLPKDPTAPLDRRPVGLPSGGGVDAAVQSSPSPAPGAPLEAQDRLKALHDALPTDLQRAAHATAMAAGISSDRRRWTVDHLPELERILDAATAEHGKRLAKLASIVTDLDDETFVGWLCAAVGIDDLQVATADQALAFEALVDAYGTGDDAPVTVTFDDGGTAQVVTNPAAAEAALVAAHGSKSAAVAAAKEAAAVYGRPNPRSVAQAASDPILTALALAEA